MAFALSLLFAVFLLLMVGLKYWLAWRQMSHVGAHADRVPARFADRISLEAHRKAAAYTIARQRLGLVETAVGAIVLLGLTLLGGLQAIASALAGPLGNGLAYQVGVVAVVVVLLAIIDLPFDWYRQFRIESRFGFNRMTPRLFFADLLRTAALSAALGLPLLTLVLWLMQRMGSLWWLYVWLAWMAFNVLVLLAFPTFIAPLFNRFSKLDDPSLAGRIESLLKRCGFRASGLYVMDGSKRSSHGNAYFTGFGAAKRIVFFDTLLSRLTPPEVEAVLAHELGHYRLHHVWKRIALLFAASAAFLWILGQLIEKPWFYEGLGVSQPSTAAALLLLLLVVPVFTFFLHPLSTLYSRRHEFEADAYAAQHADSTELVRALVKLYQDNAATLTPDPVHSAFYDSHPPAAVRIARLRAA